MLKPIFGIARVLITAQIGSYLGDTPKHGAGTPKGLALGPVNVTLSNVAPAAVVGLLCGNSMIYSLLTSYALSSIIGDKFEEKVLQQIGQ